MSQAVDSNYLIDHPQDGFDADYSPSVSICISTLNDGATLARCLRSLNNQNYPNMTITVIDAYSDDDTIEIAEDFSDRILFDDQNYGSACRKSVEETDGEIVGLFDGDIYFPHEDWLAEAVSRFSFSDNVSTVWPRNIAPEDGSLLTNLYFEHWNLIIEDRISHSR